MTDRAFPGADGAHSSADDWRLAQANLARLRYPPDDPRVAEFITALDHVNHLAERAPGFVWRYVARHGHVTVTDDDPLLLINLSVWRSYPSLHEFTYRSRHGHYVRRRNEWFDRIAQPSTVLWWIRAGTTPTPADGLARLTHLRSYGPTAQAFSLRVHFRPDGRPDTEHRSGRTTAPRR